MQGIARPLRYFANDRATPCNDPTLKACWGYRGEQRSKEGGTKCAFPFRALKKSTLGTLLGRSWSALVRFWGPSWSPLGLLSWGSLGGVLGRSWGFLEPRKSELASLPRMPKTCFLGRSWRPLAGLFGSFGARPGSSWASLGPSWGNLGAPHRKRKGETAQTLNNTHCFEGCLPLGGILGRLQGPLESSRRHRTAF